MRRTEQALSRRRLIRLMARLPYKLTHRLIVAAARAETWLRYPLWALNVRDAYEEAFDLLDPDGTRAGLTERVRKRFRDNLFYNEMADVATLLLYLDDEGFRREGLRLENEETLREALAEGPGAIVAGFRVGAYAALPWVLGTLGRSVLMIVGDESFVRIGAELGQAFAPKSVERVQFIRARDPLVLAKSQATLKDGGIVSTLVDLSPIEYEKTTEVRLFDTTLDVAYGIPYLAAVTGRGILPTALTRAKGPRYTLRFGERLAPAGRDSASVRQATQEMYTALERMVLRFPDQWIGWQTLRQAAENEGETLSSPAVAPLT